MTIMDKVDQILDETSKFGDLSRGGVPLRNLSHFGRNRTEFWRDVGHEIRVFMDNLASVGIAADWFHIYRHGVHTIEKKDVEWRLRWKDSIEKFSPERVYQWCWNQRPPLKKFLGGGPARHTRNAEEEKHFNYCVSSFIRMIQAEFGTPQKLKNCYCIDEISFRWGENNAGIFGPRGSGRSLKRLAISNARGWLRYHLLKFGCVTSVSFRARMF